MTVRLLSWNVAGRKRVDEQAGAVLAREPDLIALQEIRVGTAGSWQARLEAAGHNTLSTADLLQGRTNFVLTAARGELEVTAQIDGLAYEQLALVTRTRVGRAELELVNAHVPNGSTYGWDKIKHLKAVRAFMETRSGVPRLLCGDFNSPRRELDDGTLITWGQTEDGELRADRGKPWDEAERGVVGGMGDIGLRDVWRAANPGPVTEGTWVPHGGRGTERRFDHVFAPADLALISCDYIHSLRRQRLSDHSAIEVILRDPVLIKA